MPTGSGPTGSTLRTVTPASGERRQPLGDETAWPNERLPLEPVSRHQRGSLVAVAVEVEILDRLGLLRVAVGHREIVVEVLPPAPPCHRRTGPCAAASPRRSCQRRLSSPMATVPPADTSSGGSSAGRRLRPRSSAAPQTSSSFLGDHVQRNPALSYLGGGLNGHRTERRPPDRDALPPQACPRA